MNPHETFAADRSLLHSPSEIDFLSELFAFGGFEGLLMGYYYPEKNLLGHVILFMMKGARSKSRVAIKPFNDL